MLQMLESIVLVVLSLRVLKEPSDFKEAMPLLDEWKCATIISGAQCVMTLGMMKMHKWLAGNWDSLKLVML